MGQKANLQTLRNSLKNPLSLATNNSKIISKKLNFIKYIIQLFFKKNIIVSELTLNLVNNQLFLNLILFFRSAKLLIFKNKKQKQDIKNKENFIQKKFLLLFYNQINSNNIFFNSQILNYQIKKSILNFLYWKNKRFMNGLFSRRQFLFFDTLKISCLLCENLICSKTFLTVLIQIFRILPKRKHGTFLVFLKELLILLIEELPKKKIKTTLKGIKFILNGKLKGKTRSSTNLLRIGIIPTQSISKNIKYFNAHAYTIYGAFGFKLWVYHD